MNKSVVVISTALVGVASVAVALVLWQFPGGQSFIDTSDIEELLHSDSSELENKAQAFLEHLQYRDFDAAREMYSPATRHGVRLKTWLAQQFEAPAEELNLRDLEIEKVDISSDGRRARTHFRSVAELIVAQGMEADPGTLETREAKGILFWRKHAGEYDGHRGDERWYLQPESAIARSR